MIRTITCKTKGKVKEMPKDTQHARTKEGRKLVLLMVGSYFTQNPSNVVYNQIMKFNNNRQPKTNISHQSNLPLYNKS